MTDSSEEGEQGRSAPESPLPSDDELAELRELLLAEIDSRVGELEERLDDPARRAEEMGRCLPQAIVHKSQQDGKLMEALLPNVEHGLKVSVDRDPRPLVDALYPIMGPSMRKSIREFFDEKFESLSRLLERGFSIEGFRWRLEALRTSRPFSELVLLHTIVYRVEQVFLIHKDTGLVLQHVVAPNVATQDPDMISGMLVAIQDFVRDSFHAAQEDALQTFRVGDLTIWIEQGQRAFIASVVRGSAPPEVRRVFQGALDAIHLKHREGLESFQGDASSFEVSKPILEECLVEALRGREKTSFRRAWAVFGLLVILLAIWGATAIRSHLRWTDLIDKLEKEPGIVIIKAEKHYGRYRIYGLRDPLAASPEKILNASKLNHERLVAIWEPYQALDPPLILQRAQRLLHPPSGVSLKFRQGVISASGYAPGSWVVKAQELAPAIAGVQKFDESGLMASSQKRIEECVIHFEKGTTRLRPRQEKTVEALIGEIGDLREYALRQGKSLRIEIVGHTDGSKSGDPNLSGDRARRVLDILVSRGLARNVFFGRGVGSRQPMRREINEEDRSLNRRVSFRVIFETLPGGSKQEMTEVKGKQDL